MPGKKTIYLDNTGTTRTRREVISVMKKYFSRIYANPSSAHMPGLEAKSAVETARDKIASILNCALEELVFTGSGSESNSLAVLGAARALRKKGNHIITSKIEHNSILKACGALKKEGFEITYLDVDHEGRFNLPQLEESIKKSTILAALGYVNNEIGTIQDTEKIASIIKKHGVTLHIDAVQALPYLKLNLNKMNCDLVSFSGHKLYAPKGAGLLYVKKGTPLEPLIYGGGQESGLRSGTENVPYIAGLAEAIILNNREKDSYNKKLILLRNKIISAVMNGIPEVILTGGSYQPRAQPCQLLF